MTSFLIILAVAAVIVFLKGRIRVPSGSVFIVERLGRYHRTLEPGSHFIAPFIDAVRHRHSLDGVSPLAHSLSARTSDHRDVALEFSSRVRVANPEKASYAVHDPAEFLRELIRIQVEREVQNRTWDQLRESRREIEGAVLRASREASATTGIQLVEFRVTRLEVSA